MKRETFNVSEKQIDDFTDTNCTWEIKKQKYVYVTRQRISGDGEWFSVIVQRESDKKFFEFSWGRGNSGNYYYEPLWQEVKEIITIKKEYVWK